MVAVLVLLFSSVLVGGKRSVFTIGSIDGMVVRRAILCFCKTIHRFLDLPKFVYYANSKNAAPLSCIPMIWRLTTARNEYLRNLGYLRGCFPGSCRGRAQWRRAGPLFHEFGECKVYMRQRYTRCKAGKKKSWSEDVDGGWPVAWSVALLVVVS